MPTTVRTHPLWVAGLAALAAAVTVCALALAGAFDSDPVLVVKPAPALVVEPTTGGIDSVGDTKGDLPASRLGHGAAGYRPAGDTKGDVTAGTPAVGQELAYQAGTAAGAGH
jgi:hypothetical protein